MSDYATFLTGLVAAPHTPMQPDFKLNLALVPRQAAHLARTGVKGVFIAGTTGEGIALTLEERFALTESWATAAREHRLRLVVHAGSNSLADACSLAAHAQASGAQAVSAMAPTYYKPERVGDLVAYCASIARSAPRLPFYYYDIPALTGVSLPMREFLQLGRRRIPNLAGLKFTNLDFAQLQACLQFDGGAFNILFGCDEALLAGLVLGAHGAVGSTYNYAAPLYLEMIRAFRRGNLSRARVLQYRSVQLVEVLRKYGVLAAGKAAMAFVGIDCGPVRPPLRNLTGKQLENLEAELNALGVLARPPIED
jgi:N-acetylneuraminate lyase